VPGEENRGNSAVQHCGEREQFAALLSFPAFSLPAPGD
jgi:hypothetical protein